MLLLSAVASGNQVLFLGWRMGLEPILPDSRSGVLTNWRTDTIFGGHAVILSLTDTFPGAMLTSRRGTPLYRGLFCFSPRPFLLVSLFPATTVPGVK